MLSLQNLGSEDVNCIFSAIKTAFSEKDLWEVMANVLFLILDST